MEFRVYLLNTERRIAAAASFMSSDSQLAGQIARAVYGACRPKYSGFELWQGDHIVTDDQRCNAESLGLNAEAQQIVADCLQDLPVASLSWLTKGNWSAAVLQC